jgi:hypothetical protein
MTVYNIIGGVRQDFPENFRLPVIPQPSIKCEVSFRLQYVTT